MPAIWTHNVMYVLATSVHVCACWDYPQMGVSVVYGRVLTSAIMHHCCARYS